MQKNCRKERKKYVQSGRSILKLENVKYLHEAQDVHDIPFNEAYIRLLVQASAIPNVNIVHKMDVHHLPVNLFSCYC
jgi:hypothetical protein